MRIKTILSIIIFLFTSLLFYAWQKTQNIRLGYELAELKGICDKITEENLDLQLKISSFLSMEKLDAVSVKKGLFVPEEKNIIYLEKK